MAVHGTAAHAGAASSATSSTGSGVSAAAGSTHTHAGTRSHDHYRSNMTPFRFRVRSALLPLIRAETEPLAALQRAVRTPLLDQYFALTANLGTHTFYMVMLPSVLWAGNWDLAVEMVWLLSVGVYLTGFVKDYLCLPRPRSPPVHRISMSGSAVLEYGFPSTHSCNTVSVGILFAEVLTSRTGHFLNALLVFSIVTGRLYNGMHGLFDVVFGAAAGALVWWLRAISAKAVDSHFELTSPILIPALSMLLGVVFAIVVHPQPVDNCPCYDDSVAFLSVLQGLYFGVQFVHWRGSTIYDFLRMDPTYPAWVSFPLRIVLGVAVLATWRATMKPLLFKVLPPILRALKTWGVDLPRRYFLSASDYDRLPPRSEIPDELLPDTPAEVVEMLRKVRRSRGRSDSVGPQSEADWYEEKENRRRSASSPTDAADLAPEPQEPPKAPRVRYDVEVTTKVIVYSGIPFLVVTGCMDLFRLLSI